VDDEDSRKHGGAESKAESSSGHDLLDLGGDPAFDALDQKAPIKVGTSSNHVKKSAVLTATSRPVVTASISSDPFGTFDPFSTQPPAPPAAHSDFDPFATQQPVAPVAASDVDPFAEPIPVVKSTPTPFDDLLAVPVPITAAPVSAVAAAPTAAPSGAMTDADFDSFFNELDKK
jgi:hypothetical protein